MFATATTLLTALALLGHSVIGCDWHHSAHDDDAPHSERVAQEGDSVESGHETDHEELAGEGRCTYLKPPRVPIRGGSPSSPPQLIAAVNDSVIPVSLPLSILRPRGNPGSALGLRAVRMVWLL